jgi:hypothetical protein
MSKAKGQEIFVEIKSTVMRLDISKNWAVINNLIKVKIK